MRSVKAGLKGAEHFRDISAEPINFCTDSYVISEKKATRNVVGRIADLSMMDGQADQNIHCGPSLAYML